jgi:hypothetical protein
MATFKHSCNIYVCCHVKNLLLNITIKFLALLLCIPDVSASKLGSQTGYSDWICKFHEFIDANVEIVVQFLPDPSQFILYQ